MGSDTHHVVCSVPPGGKSRQTSDGGSIVVHGQEGVAHTVGSAILVQKMC